MKYYGIKLSGYLSHLAHWCSKIILVPLNSLDLEKGRNGMSVNAGLYSFVDISLVHLYQASEMNMYCYLIYLSNKILFFFTLSQDPDGRSEYPGKED